MLCLVCIIGNFRYVFILVYSHRKHEYNNNYKLIKLFPMISFHSINDKLVRQVTVRRVLRSTDSREVTKLMTTVLTREGRIVTQEWSNSNWILKSEIAASMETEEEDISGGVEEEAAEEALKADQTAYFQRKQEVLTKLKEYFLAHSDLQDLIADLVKSTLFQQPQDVVDFADTFFLQTVGRPRLEDPPWFAKETTSITRQSKAETKGSDKIDAISK